ncbi:hypothetical protein [Priestia megaterium]|uniref:SF0329 family protein n=1 Tax=Priestia megaterium TaxID=1404 RepID=UPI00237C2270|nr:hypothetical protein [Priestia megaterium]MDD9791778.1 hypothetical protein [Priestia megaterium]
MDRDKEKTDKYFPDCLYECFPEFIGKVDDGEYSTIILEYKGIFIVDLVHDAFIQYPHFSIEKALNSKDNIIQALSLLDKRLGKRKLEAMDSNLIVHPLIRKFYELRCEVEGIMPYKNLF